MVINRRMLFAIAFTLSAFGITAHANPNLAPINLSTSDTNSGFSELNRIPSLTNTASPSVTSSKSRDAVFSVTRRVASQGLSAVSRG